MTTPFQAYITVLAEVGAFKFFQNDVGETFVEGPVAYLQKQGARLLANIDTGGDAIFNTTCAQSSTLEIAVLVRLQTDYAAWRGLQQFCANHGID